MKNFWKVIMIVGVMVAFIIAGVRVDASAEGEVLVREEEDGYVLDLGEGAAISRPSLSSIFEALPLGISRVRFEGVTASETLAVSRSVTLSGELSFSGGELIIEDGEVVFNGLNLEFEGAGGVRLKSGSLTVIESTVASGAVSAVRLDYSASASFKLLSGKLTSSATEGTVAALYGSVSLLGGRVENALGAAVVNRTSLSLGGAPELAGAEFDIVSDCPVSLTSCGSSFCGSATVRIEKSFEAGSFTPVLYKTTESALSDISLFDKNGVRAELSYFAASKYSDEKSFAAVYLPFCVTFMDESGAVGQRLVISGERFSPIELSERVGYSFCGWYRDASCQEPFEFDTGVTSDLTLYSRHELLPPSYTLRSLRFIYDGETHFLALDSVFHPLLSEGTLVYEWYKNGAYVGGADKLALSTVKDGGNYYCKLSFTHNGNLASVVTGAVFVSVEKACVALPTVAAKEYTGAQLFPEVSASAFYTVSCVGGVAVGSYPVVLTLRDPDNYRFAGFETSEIELSFEIVQAVNRWLVPPSDISAFEGAAPVLSAKPLFGSASYLFSATENGVYTEVVPSTAGSYFMRVVVAETESYSALESAPQRFSLLPEELVSIYVDGEYERNYSAFDSFNAEGLRFFASYNSGRVAELAPSELTLAYRLGSSLRVGDSTVKFSYGTAELLLPVVVSPIVYDVSELSLPSLTAVYDGAWKTLTLKGALPTGLDGLTLSASVVGGGVNVGSYTVQVIFASAGSDYLSPAPLTATLEILPLERPVSWGALEFVYDGCAKLPSAYFFDVRGNKIPLQVAGAKTRVGVFYASATSGDGNYALTGSTVQFTIRKAVYDMSSAAWSSSTFVYDGGEKSVHITGLPEGVGVLGYTDASAVAAGSYTASATLSYDSENYEPPVLPPHAWCIERASYPTGGFSFSDVEVVFDGATHYPKLLGEMPVGADGVALSYRFLNGATHVAEGRVGVTIEFVSTSPNYCAPPPMSAAVTVLPRGIYASWSGLTPSYTGSPVAPEARAPEAELRVIGAATNAGSYVAEAVSQNADYYVVNASCSFSVLPAANRWLAELSAAESFAGEAPRLAASALGGTVTYRYFSDAALTSEVFAPLAAGNYYVVAESDGGGNYTAIVSDPVLLTVSPLAAVELSVELAPKSYRAFERLTPSDFSAYIRYNSGSVVAISSELVAVNYSSGEALLASDEEVNFSACGVSVSVPISVARAEYDASGVFWSGGTFVYDGSEKSIELLGLPEGVEVVSYIGNARVETGIYSVEARVSYDSVNYEPPSLPQGTLTIEKRLVPTPKPEPRVYNGEALPVTIENADLYNYSKILYRDGGKYYITLSMKDAANYAFLETGSPVAVVTFEILPAEIVVVMDSVKVYRFDEPRSPVYSLVGVPEGLAAPELVFTVENGAFTCTTNDSNYKLTLRGGDIEYVNALSPERRLRIFTAAALVLLLALALTALLLKRDKLRRLLCRRRVGRGVLGSYHLAASPAPHSFAVLSPPRPHLSFAPPIEWRRGEKSGAPSVPSPLPAEVEKGRELIPTCDPVNVSRADALISDGTAKNLLRRAERVETFGRRRAVVNVDTLSAAFSAGEHVDVNLMKRKGLVPYDTAVVKVLARGTIDKPLKIYANDFSLSAVKMIALTGGEAVKVSTVRLRLPRSRRLKMHKESPT